MAIYTRFGGKVEIMSYVGFDKGTDSFQVKFVGEWVRVRFAEDGSERDTEINELRADGGWGEICRMIEAVRYPEADGTSPYMVENQYGCRPNDDWLRVATVVRQHQTRGTFTSNDEYGWIAGHYAVMGRYHEAAEERERTRRLWAALLENPGLAVDLAIADAKLNFAAYHNADRQTHYNRYGSI